MIGPFECDFCGLEHGDRGAALECCSEIPIDPGDQLVTDGGSIQPPEDGIYLAGPVEQTDDPRTWRDRVKAQFPDVQFIDPMDWQDEWQSDPCGCIEKELRVCESNPILAYNIGRDGPRTVGTHHEIAHALAHGNDRIVVVPNGDLPGFIEHRTVELADSIEAAVSALLDNRALVTDGGERKRRALHTETDRAEHTSNLVDVKLTQEQVDLVDDGEVLLLEHAVCGESIRLWKRSRNCKVYTETDRPGGDSA